jgi:hypothetical protein
MAPPSVLTSPSLGSTYVYVRSTDTISRASFTCHAESVAPLADRAIPTRLDPTRLHRRAPPSAAVVAAEATAAVNRSHVCVASARLFEYWLPRPLCGDRYTQQANCRWSCDGGAICNVMPTILAVAEAQDWQWDISGDVVSD